MELTLDIILYKLKDLKTIYIKRSDAEHAFTGLRQLYHAPKSKNIFSTSNLYLTELSTVWKMRKSLHKEMSILAVSDKSMPEERLAEIPGSLIVFDIEGGISNLMNCVLQIIEEFAEWDKNMHTGSLEGRSIQELVTYSENIIHESMLIFDTSFDVIAHSENVKNEYAIFAKTLSLGYTASTVMKQVKELQIFQKLENNNYLTVAASTENSKHNLVYMGFVADESVLGYGAIYIGEGIPSQGYLDIVRLFIENISLCFKRDFEKKHYGRMMYETFLLNLIHAENISTKQLDEQLDNIENLSRHGIMTLGVLKFSSSTKVPKTFLSNIISRNFSDAHVFLSQDSICMLKYHKSVEECKLSESEQKHLEKVLENYNFVFGMSNIFYDLIDLRYVWREADFAADQTEKNGKIIGYYSDYLYDDIIMTMNEIVPARLLRANCYERLRVYDEQHKTNYCQILLTYLENDCNASHTAQKMFLHRNTIYKAVQFAEQELGIDLNDAKTKEQLFFSRLADRF